MELVMAYKETMQQQQPSLNLKLVGDIKKPYVEKLYFLLHLYSISQALHFFRVHMDFYSGGLSYSIGVSKDTIHWLELDGSSIAILYYCRPHFLPCTIKSRGIYLLLLSIYSVFFVRVYCRIFLEITGFLGDISSKRTVVEMINVRRFLWSVHVLLLNI